VLVQLVDSLSISIVYIHVFVVYLFDADIIFFFLSLYYQCQYAYSILFPLGMFAINGIYCEVTVFKSKFELETAIYQEILFQQALRILRLLVKPNS
jgi:hypothetical protein